MGRTSTGTANSNTSEPLTNGASTPSQRSAPCVSDLTPWSVATEQSNLRTGPTQPCFPKNLQSHNKTAVMTKHRADGSWTEMKQWLELEALSYVVCTAEAPPAVDATAPLPCHIHAHRLPPSKRGGGFLPELMTLNNYPHRSQQMCVPLLERPFHS